VVLLSIWTAASDQVEPVAFIQPFKFGAVGGATLRLAQFFDNESMLRRMPPVKSERRQKQRGPGPKAGASYISGLYAAPKLTLQRARLARQDAGPVRGERRSFETQNERFQFGCRPGFPIQRRRQALRVRTSGQSFNVDRGYRGERRPQGSTVDPNRIADPWSTAFLLVIAFPPLIAYRRPRADPGPPVCRNPIACHPWPSLYLRLQT
jgi:hypothetical protein